jgi:hypothetical protein
LGFVTWGHLDPTTTTISVIDAANVLHVLDHFVEPSLEAMVGGSLGCSGAGPLTNSYDLSAFAGQTVTIRLETTAPGVNGTITDFDDVSVTTAMPQVYWVGGTGYWSDPTKWSPALPSFTYTVIVPSGSLVMVNAGTGMSGILMLEPGATLQVLNGAVLSNNQLLVNNGTLLNAGTILCNHAQGNIAMVQNNYLILTNGGVLRAASGTNFVFQQTAGSTIVGPSSTLDWGNGQFQVRAGAFNVAKGGNVAFGSFGQGGYGLTQSGGTVSFDGTVTIDGSSGGQGLAIQDGQFTVGSDGNVAFSGFGQGGAGISQSGGAACIDGALGLGGLGSGGVSVAYSQTGGTLSGSGTIDGSLVADGGVIAPGDAPGTLTVTSNFTQNADNTLRVRLTGAQAGQFDQLYVGHTAVLGGRFEVDLMDSFAPTVGQKFPFLVTANLSGKFSQITAPTGISVTYSKTGVEPKVTGVVPAQILGPLLSGSNALFTFGTVKGRRYTVEWSASLHEANWLVWTNLTGTGAKLQVAVPLAEAAQRFFRVNEP